MTPSGNPCAPSKSMMVEWVKAAWETLSPDIIIHSFAACGITTAQPDMIHCIKENIAPEARQVERLAKHFGCRSARRNSTKSQYK